MRIKKLQQNLISSNLALAVFLTLRDTNPNILYFSGYKGYGALVVPIDKKPFLLAPARDHEKAKATGLRTYKCKKPAEKLSEILINKKLSPKRIGIDKENMTLLGFEKLKKTIKANYKDISFVCQELRMIKDKNEINNITKACMLTDKIFSKVATNFRFRYEQELKNYIEFEIKRAGDELAFSPIIASGSRASNPHHEPSGKIKNGFLVIDFGVRYNGYCSDMTRTLYIGTPTKKEVELYSLVQKTQDQCISNIGLNSELQHVYHLALRSFGKNKKHFIHGLGHGLGLEIHEMPSINGEEQIRVQNNMVFTIEPGLYFEHKLGIRIEDTVLFYNKPVRLTDSTRELIIIKK